MQLKICKYIQIYAEICRRKYAHVQKYAIENMHEICNYIQKYAA